MKKNSYPYLLSEGRIGTLTLRNRIVMTPMGSNLGEGDGTIGARSQAYYLERAKGGAGLLIMGSVAIAWPLSSVIPRQAALANETHVPGIQELAAQVHAHGCKLALQLHFGGLMSTVDTAAGRPLWTPSVPAPKLPGDMADGILKKEFSALAAPLAAATPEYRVLTEQDISTLVNLFATAAQRAQRAGVDGVEIHAGHGYIISEFISPNSNHRTDKYGGSVENRARVLTDVLKGIRNVVGRTYPVWCRIDSEEFFQPEGVTLEDAKVTAQLAELAGADAIHVSAYADPRYGIAHSSAHTPQEPELLVPNAAAIRAVVNIPVIAVGHLEPGRADHHIAAGRFDFVAMGRKLLADPHLPNKLAHGQARTIRPCIYSYSCNSQIYIGGNVNCAVNPETGRELEFGASATEQPKRVVVVGAGAAGLECSRRLAARGHAVTLLEQSPYLGGALRAAAVCYEPIGQLLRWLLESLESSKVSVRLCSPGTAETIRALSPDFVVLALGSQPAPVTSFEMPVSSTGSFEFLFKARPAHQRDATNTPSRHSIIVGNDVIALELAAHLARKREIVTVIDRGDEFGHGAPLVRRWRLLHELRGLEVNLLSGAQELSALEGFFSYRTRYGQTRTLAADRIVVASRVEAGTDLAAELQDQGIPCRAIGDCAEVAYIDQAMRSAARIALEI